MVQNVPVVRKIQVDRTLHPEEVLKAINRQKKVNPDVVACMPGCEGDFEASFVNLGRWVQAPKLVEELAKEGWELIVDPLALLILNAEDSAFADTHPNATQWQCADNNYRCVTFSERYVGPHVYIDRDQGAWRDYWWFPCRRQELST